MLYYTAVTDTRDLVTVIKANQVSNKSIVYLIFKLLEVLEASFKTRLYMFVG